MISVLRPLTITLSFFLLTLPGWAEEKDPRTAAGVQDNSFLIEEAYNQEAGVVQHIASLRRQNRDWYFNFTQEWPLGSQTHQFSYSVPYSWIRTEEGRVRGIGDAQINYRFQALTEGDGVPAFAPRLSWIFPSGNKEKGTGVGSHGLQVNLPVSKIVSDRVTLHGNAGVTTYFNVDGKRPTNYNLGGSAVYAVNRDFNLMLESLGEWTESVNELREIEREFRFTVSPGFRQAFNLDAGQLVVGLATPVGFVNGNRPDYGVLLYLSFEHSFLKKAK